MAQSQVHWGDGAGERGGTIEGHALAGEVTSLSVRPIVGPMAKVRVMMGI